MQWLRHKVIEILLGKEETLPPLSKDAAMALLSDLYQNQAFRRFLDAREEYLIKAGMEKFMANELTKADRYAGQLVEIRNLRTRTRNAYIVIDKQRKSSLTKK